MTVTAVNAKKQESGVMDVVDVDDYSAHEKTEAPTTNTTTSSGNYEPVSKTDIEKPSPGIALAATPVSTDARLHWESIRLTVQTSKDNHLTILDNVWGEAPQGQVTAIMGPSGSGYVLLDYGIELYCLD